MDPLADLPLIASGKVREMYDLGERMLMVASDRISTYDAVHPTPIPGKGQVLTGMSVFWFGLTAEIVPNHLISATEGVPAAVRGRALVVRGSRCCPVECVVRGYLSGSGWNDYQRSGAVCGIALPERAARVRAAARAALHAGDEGRARRPRREHRLRGRRPRRSATAASPSGCATPRSPSTSAPPSTRASAASSSPTRSSSSASRPTARWCSATRC